ncbi:hypothetical protein ACIQWL_39255 [Streptomyces mirabilis]|uniref:hypothetical protein n=1 Tax=Streptomyces mirabilis TaxID=68239 RepID=UPI0033ECE4BE
MPWRRPRRKPRAAPRKSTGGGLLDAVDAESATDPLWFYLNNGAYFTLTEDNYWSLDNAEEWLLESLRTALLNPATQ